MCDRQRLSCVCCVVIGTVTPTKAGQMHIGPGTATHFITLDRSDAKRLRLEAVQILSVQRCSIGSDSPAHGAEKRPGPTEPTRWVPTNALPAALRMDGVPIPV